MMQGLGWVKSDGSAMSALLPLYTLKADIHRKVWHVSKLPISEVALLICYLAASCAIAMTP
jgi:hypothetical protein